MENIIKGQTAGFRRIFENRIPNHWQLLDLRELAEIEYGISDALDVSVINGIKILSLPNVNKQGEFILDEVPMIKRENVKARDILQEGDLLFNWRNGSKEHLGKTAFFNLKGEYTHVGFLLRIRTSSRLDSFYLKSYINFLRNKGYFLKAKIQVNNTFNKEELGELPLMLPPLPEQKAIAALLSTWDKAIEKTTQLIAQKELRKKALMQQLLTGKKRLKGFKGDWKEVEIREIAKEISVKNREDKSLTVLSCTKYDGLVSSLEYFGRKIFSDDLSTYKVVYKNCFAYATNHIEEGSIGYQDQFSEALISPMYTVFSTKGIDDYFLYKVLKQPSYISEYKKRMEGSIDRRGGLRWNEFSKIKIFIPSVEEQNAVTMVIKSFEKEDKIQTELLEKLKEQKKGLMQVLLTGKKRLV